MSSANYQPFVKGDMKPMERKGCSQRQTKKEKWKEGGLKERAREG